MSNVPIYKIYKLVGIDIIETIYIFNSNFKDYEEDQLREIFKKNPNEGIFSNTFKDDEIEQIKTKNINIEFISENIYVDDSIGVIKLKIFNALNRDVSIDEIYMYSLIKDIINPTSIYQILTQNNKLKLSKIRLEQFLLNIYRINKKIFKFDLPEKDEYSYDDIINLNLENEEYYLTQPLGQKFVFSSNYPFISNPYLVNEYDNLLENSRNELSSLNNNLLLDTSKIIDNIIYICLAEDVFNYNESIEISTDYSCKIYFPFLYKDDIKTLDDLRENKNILIKNSLSKFDQNTKKYFKTIDLFYDIYKNHKDSKYFNQLINKTGINYFKIVIYPEYDIVIPVDIIFKIMHSTKNNPLIKFNPSFKQENIYRLYSNEVTKNGNKIPYLSVAKINDLRQKIGKTKSVSIYSVITYNFTDYEMIFEIDSNSHIMIYPLKTLDVPIFFSLKENIFENIDNLISLTIEPIIQEIKHIFEQTGISLPSFKSIYSNNIEIREMNYQTVYNIKKDFNLNKYKKCISSIFNFENMNEKNNIYELRFKRVSNFNKYNNQEAYVIEKLDEGKSFEEIQEELLENYKELNSEDAIEIITRIIKYIELTRGSKRKRNLIIKNNPGFPSIFKVNKHDATLTINIQKINNIYYLNTLSIYLDSIIRIIEDPSSIIEKEKYLNEICVGTDRIEELNFEDINSYSEGNILSNRVPDIVDEVPIYSDYREIRDEETDLNDIVGIFEDLEKSDIESDSEDLDFDGGMNSVLNDSESNENYDSDDEIEYSDVDIEQHTPILKETKYPDEEEFSNVNIEQHTPILKETKYPDEEEFSDVDIEQHTPILKETEYPDEEEFSDVDIEKLIPDEEEFSDVDIEKLIPDEEEFSDVDIEKLTPDEEEFLNFYVEKEYPDEEEFSDVDIEKKQTKKVFISELNKNVMLELIGYNIAKTFSKYINILSNMIDEVLKIKLINLKNKKIIKQIVDKFSLLINTLKNKEKEYENKYIDIGGNISSLDINNYYEALKDDNMFSFNIDDNNNIHLIYHNKDRELKVWISNIKKRINKKIQKNSERIDKLIEKYRSDNKSDISTNDEFDSINFDKEEISLLKEPEEPEEPEEQEEEEQEPSSSEESQEISVLKDLEEEEKKREIEEILEISDDELSLSDIDMLESESESELEEKKDVIDEYQTIINPFVDVNVTKFEEIQPSSSSSELTIPSKSSSSSEEDEEDEEDKEYEEDDQDIISIIEDEQESDEIGEEEEEGEIEGEEEEEEEEEEEGEEEIEMKEKEEDIIEEQSQIIDPTGMKLTSPNYFTKRLTERANEVFGKSKNDNFDYTRSCEMTTSIRRQPVILTKQEKNRILKEYNDLDEEKDFMEYSSDPTDESKTFYYTCPRFWCLKTNKMITEKDILDGKCGPKVDNVRDAIIPVDSKEVPKNKFVYEFINKTGKKQYPGFHKEKRKYIDKNGKEKELCVPCCFGNFNSVLKRRNECQIGTKNKINENMTINERKIHDELIKQSVKGKDEKYIQDGETYGKKLGEYRRALVPTIIQHFLHEIGDDCVKKGVLEQNKSCLLRTGVEYDEKKSFVACIANYIFYKEKYYNFNVKKNFPLINKYYPENKIEVPRINQMIEIIISSLTIDNYIKYQNGDLINIFYSPDVKISKNNMKQYYNSKLYKKIFEKNKIGGANSDPKVDQYTINISKKKKIKEKSKHFFIKVVQSFENFKIFLRNKNSYVDYTYLWDIICMPNSMLMPSGINMVILNIPDRDMTSSVELICPTNHYLTHIYNSRKKTIIIIKRKNIFEPLYLYKEYGSRLEIIKYFSEYDRKLTKTMRSVFSKIIRPILKDKCLPLSVYPKSRYNFKQPILLDTLIEKLNKKNYKIKKQILNYEGKVIGIIAKNKELNLEGFIPCYPSALTSLIKEKYDEYEDSEYKFAYMDDTSWLKDYYETLSFLLNYYDLNDKQIEISCQDDTINGFCRVVEDGVVSGFLTDTNQFIPINPTIMRQDINDDNINDIDYNSTYNADMNILTSNEGDGKRAIFVKRVELETNYYNIFRNVIRILLNDYKNIEKRRQISNECNNKFKPYLDKLRIVEDLLHELVDDYITFLSEDEGYDIDKIQIDKMQNCVNDDLDKCSTKKNLCAVMGDKCRLIIPKNNLVTNKDNEILYFGKITDELIRYNRISSFIFKPNSFLSFMKIKYKINSDEIILLESMMTQEYFEQLLNMGINKYVKGKTYDTANPLITYNRYSNEEYLDDVINPDYEKEYEISEPTKIYNKYPRNIFPSNYKEVTYSGSHDVGLYLILHLLEKFKKQKITIKRLKELLVSEYERYTDNMENYSRMKNLISALNEEGQIDTNQLQDRTMNFDELIMNEGFIPTNLDLWILLNRLKIPSLFISIKFIAETRFNKKEFITYFTNEITKMAVIIIPASFQRKRGIYPIYKLILNESNDEKIDVNIIESSEELFEAIQKKITIENYLDKFFIKDNKTKHKKRKPGNRAFDELLEKDIKQKEISKKSNYNISFKPGERAKKLEEMEIEEPEESVRDNSETEYELSDFDLEPPSTSLSESISDLKTSDLSFLKDLEDKEKNVELEKNEIPKFKYQEDKKKNKTKKIVENIRTKTHNIGVNKTRKNTPEILF